MRSIHRKCQGGHVHLPVQGKFAKASATYHDGVASALCSVFVAALAARPAASKPFQDGLESLRTNDTLTCAEWEVTSCWSWPSPKHINVYESEPYIGHLRAPAEMCASRSSQIPLLCWAPTSRDARPLASCAGLCAELGPHWWQGACTLHSSLGLPAS